MPSNPPEAIAITDRLYGGNEEHRLRQEIILGIGGVRALRALDIHPQVFHTNEGHAGFLGLERIREWVDRGLTFDEAIEAVRAGSLFTTHTPVPAGIDRFPRELIETYFTAFAADCGVTIDRLIAVGQSDTEHDKFNMAIMGLRLAAHSNGVARLHGEVSRDMFGDLWPGLPTREVPIGHVTNGVHARTWVSDRVDELLSQMIGDEWHLADQSDWDRVRHLDHREIWDVRNEGRHELVDMVRDRLGGSLLDPECPHDRIRPSVRHLQTFDAAAEPTRTAAHDAARRRPARAVRLRRQGPSRRRAGQGADPRDRPADPRR